MTYLLPNVLITKLRQIFHSVVLFLFRSLHGVSNKWILIKLTETYCKRQNIQFGTVFYEKSFKLHLLGEIASAILRKNEINILCTQKC